MYGTHSILLRCAGNILLFLLVCSASFWPKSLAGKVHLHNNSGSVFSLSGGGGVGVYTWNGSAWVNFANTFRDINGGSVGTVGIGETVYSNSSGDPGNGDDWSQLNGVLHRVQRGDASWIASPSAGQTGAAGEVRTFYVEEEEPPRYRLDVRIYNHRLYDAVYLMEPPAGSIEGSDIVSPTDFHTFTFRDLPEQGLWEIFKDNVVFSQLAIETGDFSLDGGFWSGVNTADGAGATPYHLDDATGFAVYTILDAPVAPTTNNITAIPFTPTTGAEVDAKNITLTEGFNQLYTATKESSDFVRSEVRAGNVTLIAMRTEAEAQNTKLQTGNTLATNTNTKLDGIQSAIESLGGGDEDDPDSSGSNYGVDTNAIYGNAGAGRDGTGGVLASDLASNLEGVTFTTPISGDIDVFSLNIVQNGVEVFEASLNPLDNGEISALTMAVKTFLIWLITTLFIGNAYRVAMDRLQTVISWQIQKGAIGGSIAGQFKARLLHNIVFVALEIAVIGSIVPIVTAIIATKGGWAHVVTNPVSSSSWGSGAIGAAAAAGVSLVWQLFPMGVILTDLLAWWAYRAGLDSIILFVAWYTRALKCIAWFATISYASVTLEAGELKVENWSGTDMHIGASIFPTGVHVGEIADGTHSISNSLWSGSVTVSNNWIFADTVGFVIEARRTGFDNFRRGSLHSLSLLLATALLAVAFRAVRVVVPKVDL